MMRYADAGPERANEPQVRHDVPVHTYSVAEAADVLGVSDDTARRWIDSGRLASTRSPEQSPGRGLRVPGDALAALAEALADEPDRDVTRASSVSARNRLAGIVVRVRADTVMAQVELVCGPYRVVSLMSADAATELGLEPGARVIASVKSTNVVVERP